MGWKRFGKVISLYLTENAMEERSYDRLCFVHTPETRFQNDARNQSAKLIFFSKKNTKFFYLFVSFFNKF